MVFVTAAKDFWEYDDILLIGTPKRQVELPKIPDIKAIAGSSVKPLQKTSFRTFSMDRLEPVEVLEVVVTSVEKSEPEPPGPEESSNVSLKKVVFNAEEKVNSSFVYPNPFRNYVNIQIKQLPSDGALFTLFDLSGKNVRQQKLNNATTRIFLGQLAAGVYSYQVTDQKGKSIAFGKLIKGE
jgi:hypothetical protein